MTIVGDQTEDDRNDRGWFDRGSPKMYRDPNHPDQSGRGGGALTRWPYREAREALRFGTMKNLLRCPKCAGKKIWVIERYRIPGEAAEGRELPVVPHQDTTKSFLRLTRVTPVGHFDLFLCDACGYSELYAAGVRGLVADPERGIRLIDTTDVNEGPFR